MINLYCININKHFQMHTKTKNYAQMFNNTGIDINKDTNTDKQKDEIIPISPVIISSSSSTSSTLINRNIDPSSPAKINLFVNVIRPKFATRRSSDLDDFGKIINGVPALMSSDILVARVDASTT